MRLPKDKLPETSSFCTSIEDDDSITKQGVVEVLLLEKSADKSKAVELLDA